MHRSALVFLMIAALMGCGGAKKAGGGPPPPTSPVITSNGGGANATRNVAENGTAVTTVTATDVNAGTTFSYSISGGADAARFAINSSSGVLTFVAAPNFEAPTDAGANNVYDVTVQVSDGALTDTQAIAVTVTDVNEVPGTTTVNFSTYLGNQLSDFVRDVAVDSSGNVYAVGGTYSSDLPTTNGTAQPNFGGYEDAFVVKFNPQGQIVWSTFLGGAELDRAYALEVSGTDVIVAGRAGASFPVTPGVIQTQFQGGQTVPNLYPHPQDGFVAKLRASNGTLVWASFFGATDDHAAIVRDVAVDPATGSIYLAASTDTGTYPQAILNAFQNGHQPNRRGGFDGVLAKLSADGTTMPWATYVGGTSDESTVPSVRVDTQGNPIVLFITRSSNAPTTPGTFDAVLNGVSDFYLAKYALDGSLAWATFVGGNSTEGVETHNLAIRTDNTLVIAGASSSTDFPTQVGAYDDTNNGLGGNGTGAGTNYPSDCAIAIIAANGASLLAGTYYGGSVGEACEGVGADSNGNVYVTGATFSSLPVTSGAYQSAMPATQSPFLAVFNRDLTALRYASYYGGSGSSAGRTLAVHAEAHFVFGGGMGAGFPLVNAARSIVASGVNHGGVADLTVPLGPG